jgi:hypothetical protein
MRQEDGGPAFPVTIGSQNDQYLCGPGMSLRDWFAGQAMNSLIKARDAVSMLNGAPDFPYEQNLAEACYLLADEMLKARAHSNESES